MAKKRVVYFNGELVDIEEAMVPVMCHSLARGSAIFEVMSLHDTPKGPAVFRVDDHIKRLFRSADLIGMTCVPEAILAREQETCFAMIATITDYDVYAEKPVSFEEVKRVMKENIDNVKKIIENVIPKIPSERRCICKDALKDAGS